MSVKYLAGFVAICGLAVAGLDYVQQAKASEGGLGVKDYLASVSSRAGLSDGWFTAEAQPSPSQELAVKNPSEESGKLVCVSVGTSKRCRSGG